jgi:adenosine deaminase
VTLGSDDPPYFGATIGGEYAVAAEHFGLGPAELAAVTETALRASFADTALRERLLGAVAAARTGR